MSFEFTYTSLLTAIMTAGLVAAFTIAGLAKLRDIDRARTGLMDFGAPERWATPLARLLALCELGIAALLAYPPTQTAGAIAAFTAFGLFTLALATQLIRGRRPACACFGALAPAAISWKSVGRNLALMALASAVLGLPTLTLATLAQAPWTAIAGLGWVGLSATWLLQLTRQNGRLLQRLEQLEQAAPAQAQVDATAPVTVGSTVPPLRLSDAQGRPFDLARHRGRPVLFLFLDAGCSHCRPLIARLHDLHPGSAARDNTALMVISEDPAVRHLLPAGMPVLVDPGWTSRAVFDVQGTPAAVSIDPSGAFAQPATHGTSAVRALLDELFAPDLAQEPHHELATA